MRYWKFFATAAILFMAALALYLPLSSPQGIFNTPDENANYFFAKKFSFSNGLRVFEPLADKVDNAIHPRGVNVIRNFLVPESFLGLPILYGTLLELTKKAWIPLVFVNALTIFAIYALYQLFSHFFERKTARLALLLGLTLPAFIYWTGRPYMHTILFLDFLILGWWMMSRGRSNLRRDGDWISVNQCDIVVGIFLGLALAMRTSEVVWVGIGTILLVFGLWLGGQFGPGIKKLAIRTFKVIFGVALVVISLLFINEDLYGSFFGTGYSVSETSLVVEGGQVPQLARVSFVEQLLFPFGFHPLEAAGRFLKYALDAMWWYTGPMLLGVLVMLSRRQKQGAEKGIQQSIPNSQFPIPNEILNSKFQNLNIRHFVGNWKLRTRTTAPEPSSVLDAAGSVRGRLEIGNLNYGYTLCWIFLSLYLIIVYGSFRAEVFADPMHPLTATIGAPYLRYWLPIFLFGAPFVAQLFIQLRSMVSPSKRFYFLFSIFYFLMTFLSIRAVVWHGPESWHGIQENLWQFAEARKRAVFATPDDAIFIVPRLADRIYFSARRVIVDVEGKDVAQIVHTLHDEQAPVFWHRGRGEIKLEPEIYNAGFKLERRFDIDPKGKVYEISNFQ